MKLSLLDLNNDILNIIGDYVIKNKIDRINKLMNEEQIINGKKIIFPKLEWWIDRDIIINRNNIISKDFIYPHISWYIYKEMKNVKDLQKNKFRYEYDFFTNTRIKILKDPNFIKVKLTKVDIRMCSWIMLQRFKQAISTYNIYLSLEDEDDLFDKYLTEKKLNLKSKKYNFNY